MVLTILLIALFAIFFLLKRRIGVSLLAVIAGVSVYDMFGKEVSKFFSQAIQQAPKDLISTSIFLAFVLIFPLVIYFRSSKGGLFGIFRIVAAALFAAIITSICASHVITYFPADTISNQVIHFIEQFKGLILACGIAAAYVDILLYRG